MGIYLMVTVELICDTCGEPMGKLHTSKKDLPVYANAALYCTKCIQRGVEVPKGSTGKDINYYVEHLNEDNIIAKAITFAIEAHKDQKRDGGKDYIVHPAQTARIVSQATEDPEIIAAAWLHDTIEDTDTTYEQLVERFGRRVANLVHEVTHEREKRPYGQAYFPRLKTRDGILIKLADRLSNISDMEAWPEQRRAAYLRKTKFWDSEPRPWGPK